MLECPIRAKSPPLGPNPDYSRVIYPDPPSHDFVIFLLIAELMRRLHCPTDKLNVRFGLIDGMLGKFDFNNFSIRSGEAFVGTTTRAYYERMLHGVLRPAIHLIGAVEEPPVNLDALSGIDLSSYVEYDYHLFQLVDAARAGFEIPKWNVPPITFKFEPPITITLRETPWQIERNSNIPEWLKFANSIKSQYNVLFIRDSLQLVHDKTFPFTTFPAASLYPDVRLALYNYSLLNFFVGNGPNIWAVFSDAAYLIFKQLCPALPNWEHGQAKGWLEQDHIVVGEQYPWATPTQRMTWKDDTFEDITQEFHQMLEILNV